MTKDRLLMIIKHVDFDRLTDWETNFLSSVERQMKRTGELSEDQERITEEIWGKHNV